ncbi:MAG: LysR substrate-binding domain-containing protein [Chloroflexi bacterium]|nr:LysR substrate-binding domain-containing protein [Chloroflexota bacterium]
MTRAAKALYLSQPSVSQAIAELETYYGVKLFERLNHRLYLTAAGERLQSYARHILNLEEQVKKELSEHKEAGALRIGASLTIGTYLLPGLISAFREKMPQVEIFTLVENTNVLQRMLLEDRIDLGLVEGPVNSPDIVEKNIRDDELVVVCAPQHPLARKKKVTISNLAGLSFIIRESGSGTRAIFENAMQEAELAWKPVGIYNNIEAIKHAVRANLGLAVVPRISIQEELRAGSIVRIKVEGLKLVRKFNFIYHRQKFFTKAMQALIDSYEE